MKMTDDMNEKEESDFATNEGDEVICAEGLGLAKMKAAHMEKCMQSFSCQKIGGG